MALRYLLYDLEASLRRYVITLSRVKAEFVALGLQGVLWGVLFIVPIALFAPPERLRFTVEFGFWAFTLFSMFSTFSWQLGMSLRREAMIGTLEEHLATNAARVTVFAGRVMIGLLLELLNAVLFAALLGLITGVWVGIRDWLLLIYSIALIVASCAAYGLLVSGWVLVTGTPGIVLQFSNWLLPLASGLLAPVSMLPEPLRTLALLTPFSHAAELLRYSTIGVEPVLPVWAELVASLALTLLLTALAVASFRLAEARVKREGFKTVSFY